MKLPHLEILIAFEGHYRGLEAVGRFTSSTGDPVADFVNVMRHLKLMPAAKEQAAKEGGGL